MLFRSIPLTLLAAASAMGQSVNIDFGSVSGSPDSSYAAAGSSGYWNVFDTVGQDPQALLDTDGAPSDLALASDFADLGPAMRIDDPGTTGNDQALLDDFLPGFGDVVIGVRVDGLEPGAYDVVVYGWGPGQTAPGPIGLFDGTCVLLSDDPPPDAGLSGCMAGAWPGTLEAGITHVRGRVVTESGTIHVQYFGSYFGASGFLNGLQLQRVACPCDRDGSGAVDVFDLLAFLQDWFAGSADENGDGRTDVFDLLAYLDCWFAGCG